MLFSRHLKILVHKSSHGRGEGWSAALLNAFDVFAQQGILEVWTDGRRHPDFTRKVDDVDAMTSAIAAIFLITPELLETPEIIGRHLPSCFERQRQGHMRVFLVACEPSDEIAVVGGPAATIPADGSNLSEVPEVEQARAFGTLLKQVSHYISAFCSVQLALPVAVADPAAATLMDVVHAPIPEIRSIVVGREAELALLDMARWMSLTSIVAVYAPAGTGKTSLVREWIYRLCLANKAMTSLIREWTFHSRGGSKEEECSEDLFLDQALDWLSMECDARAPPWEKGRRVAQAMQRCGAFWYSMGSTRSCILPEN